jgi:hypothetical protein
MFRHMSAKNKFSGKAKREVFFKIYQPYVWFVDANKNILRLYVGVNDQALYMQVMKALQHLWINYKS